MDYNKKKKLNDKINSITNKELFLEIYNIIKYDLYCENGKKKFTQNNNGIFFDLNKISNETLIKLNNFFNEQNI